MSENEIIPIRLLERWAIERALQLTNGDKTEAARRLGISLKTLYRRLTEYRLSDTTVAKSS